MTPTQIKEETAIEHGFKNYAHVSQMYKDGFISDYSFDDYFTDCMKLYASEKVKEALQLAAAKATIVVMRSNGGIISKKQLAYIDEESGTHYEVNSQSILSLLPELIEKLNKEI